MSYKNHKVDLNITVSQTRDQIESFSKVSNFLMRKRPW